MEFALYSMSLIAGLVLARAFVENCNLHLRVGRFWFHHWILALAAMIVLLYIGIDAEIAWGALTGIAIEGLRRKRWGLVQHPGEG